MKGVLIYFTQEVKKWGFKLEVTFRTRKLEKEYREHTKGVKAYGPEVARRYIQRINIIRQVRDIDELMSLPALRACARITSQNWRSDLGQICSIRNGRATGIAGLFRGLCD